MAAGEKTRDLLARARGGDREAVDGLCARYLPRLTQWARGRLPRGAREAVDTDDLVQETVLRTFGRLDSFDDRGEGALQAYLRQAVLNRIRDEVRRAGRRPRAPEGALGERPDPGPSPLEEAIGREAVALYEEALARLAEPDRAAIVARVELGLSYEEIAEALGRPSLDAARMSVTRALVRLAREMARG